MLNMIRDPSSKNGRIIFKNIDIYLDSNEMPKLLEVIEYVRDLGHTERNRFNVTEPNIANEGNNGLASFPGRNSA